jgi:Kef-type K+ transport system membrane component KefB
MRWQNKSDIFWDMLAVTSFCLLSRSTISNNWIQMAVGAFAFIMIILLIIWYIYLCITPAHNEKAEKKMRYSVIILKCFSVIVALLVALNYFWRGCLNG